MDTQLPWHCGSLLGSPHSSFSPQGWQGNHWDWHCDREEGRGMQNPALGYWQTWSTEVVPTRALLIFREKAAAQSNQRTQQDRSAWFRILSKEPYLIWRQLGTLVGLSQDHKQRALLTLKMALFLCQGWETDASPTHYWRQLLPCLSREPTITYGKPHRPFNSPAYSGTWTESTAHGILFLHCKSEDLSGQRILCSLA